MSGRRFVGVGNKLNVAFFVGILVPKIILRSIYLRIRITLSLKIVAVQKNTVQKLSHMKCQDNDFHLIVVWIKTV